ncbi:urease accessory protein UreE [Paraburkholderia susongensis]|uniref:Urease accessory protein UreE n=1 Tax=Paraburkholderia susongensis TaxID=1515439 RepID=A0A1X7KVK2_9BURK|nr:urease accessory protein UreE [Paraburkholderia susongensis]SMG45003.1 urease accessory protein [Paraburkholderia susongensis]
MRTLDKLLGPHLKIAPVLVKRAPTLTLAFDERRKSRLAATLDNGEAIALLLPRGTVLRDGDVLVADDGALVRVAAAHEAVLHVRAPDALTLTRAAYHLGNRHTPVEVGADYLKLEYDPVLADMLKRLGAMVEQAQMPFQPETGAYGGGHKHGHDETFAEDYALAQQVFGEHHGHAHAHEGSHSHAHGHEHDHSHDHDHGHSHVHVRDESCGHASHSHHAHR